MASQFDLMNILVGQETDKNYRKKPVIVQGMTGSFGSIHTRLMRDYGTNIAAGVTPGKGGQEFDGIPIYNGMGEAVKQTGASISVIFVPASNFLRAAIEALDNGIKLLVAIPEHVPVIDSLKLIEYAKLKNARIIGPNTAFDTAACGFSRSVCTRCPSLEAWIVNVMIDSSRPRAKAITSVTQEQEEVFPQCSAATDSSVTARGCT